MKCTLTCIIFCIRIGIQRFLFSIHLIILRSSKRFCVHKELNKKYGLLTRNDPLESSTDILYICSSVLEKTKRPSMLISATVYAFLSLSYAPKVFACRKLFGEILREEEDFQNNEAICYVNWAFALKQWIGGIKVGKK